VALVFLDEYLNKKKINSEKQVHTVKRYKYRPRKTKVKHRLMRLVSVNLACPRHSFTDEEGEGREGGQPPTHGPKVSRVALPGWGLNPCDPQAMLQCPVPAGVFDHKTSSCL
jgi:hypothetical protein